MFKRIIATMLTALAFNAAATVIGENTGWKLDFSQVTPEQKKAFGWFDEELKTKGFRKFTNTYTVPGMADWTLSGKVIAAHTTSGPALFSITELLNGSTIEDVKKVHYRVMSDAKGFKEVSCAKGDQGAQSCEVLVSNWSPAKAFYAVFHEWKVGDKSYVLVVRNAQSSPDRKTPEAAANILVSLIKQGD